jgi:hypothetical protein
MDQQNTDQQEHGATGTRTSRNTDQQVSPVSLDRQECVAGWGVDKDTLCTPPLLLMATFFITSRMWMHKSVDASARTYM